MMNPLAVKISIIYTVHEIKKFPVDIISSIMGFSKEMLIIINMKSFMFPYISIS